MAFEIKEGSGNMAILIKLVLPRAPSPIFLTRVIGTSDRLRCVLGCPKSHQGGWIVTTVSISRRISLFPIDEPATGTQFYHRPSNVRHPGRRVRSQFVKGSWPSYLTTSSGCSGASSSISAHPKQNGTTSKANNSPSWSRSAVSRTVW